MNTMHIANEIHFFRIFRFINYHHLLNIKYLEKINVQLTISIVVIFFAKYF